MSEEYLVCELTPEGMRIARNYLRGVRENGWTPLPTGLLTDHTYAQPLQSDVSVEERSFTSRREAGQYLAERLEPLGPARVGGNASLWSWLGMFYLEQIAHDSGRGSGTYAEIAHLILPEEHDSRDRSHHRLMMAYDIWTLHGEEAWLLLDQSVGSMSQFTLRVVQSPEIFRSKGVVQLIHSLYADRSTGRVRKGALGSDTASAPAGSLPRLIHVLNQLSMNYDVYGMTTDRLLHLLPSEFDHFESLASV